MSAAMVYVAAARKAVRRSLRTRVRAAARAPHLFEVGLLVGVYYGSAKLGYVLNFAGPVAAIVWLPVGVAIAFLSIRGLALWPGVLIGDLLANDYSALPVGAALGQTCGNMLEVLVAAVLLRRLMQRGSPLRSIAGVGAMLAALAAGTLVSAIVGPVSLALAGVVKASSFFEVARTWWLGDFCGALVLVPLAIAWSPFPRRLPPRRRLLEGALLLAVVALLGEITAHSGEPLSYLIFPALIWAAVRFGARGATTAVAAAVTMAVWATTHYEGPFAFDSISHSVESTQLFIAVAAVSSLCLAALVAEREAFARRFGESRAQLLDVAERERHRIERNLHDGAQQRLLALGVRLHLAADRADGAPDWVPATLAEAERELVLAVDELRQLSRGTHPTILTKLGLADAIRTVAARSTIPVTVLELPTDRKDETAEAVAYYLTVEGIANAIRHSEATSIQVRAISEAGTLRISVVDDGIGTAVEGPGTGLGGLRERVEAAGGTFTLTSRPGLGTTIAAVLPTT
jgi:signal transduction histidine kinase